ncbi:MAG: hypothetical protein OEZ54_09355 [Gemmatimonadota bacterium]|nr:hypothetical protein [Gemmatimonadota bacterium]
MNLRRGMTARVVPLNSKSAGNAAVAGTIGERLAIVAQLSELHWQLTARPLPKYDRGSMPVRIVQLSHSEGRGSNK